MAILTSVPSRVYAGDISIEIEGQGVGTRNGTFEISDISPIEYNYDVPSRGDEAVAIGINGGSIDITILPEISLSDGSIEMLYDLMESNMTSSDILFVTLTITDEASTDNVFQYELTLNGIEVDERNRTMKLSCTHATNNNSWVTTSGMWDWEYTDLLEHPATTGKNFIESIVPCLSKTSNNVIIDSFAFNSEPTSNGEQGWFVSFQNMATGRDGLSYFEQLAVMGALEGAVYGSGFGTDFYINRLSTGHQVSLDYDKIEDLKISRFTAKRYNFVRVAIVSKEVFENGNRYSISEDQIDAQAIVNLDPHALKSFNVVFNRGGLGRGEVDNITEKHMTLVDIKTNGDGGLTQLGADTYAQSTGGTDGMHLSFTIWGAFDIKPWQTFLLSNAPPKYQNRLFRPKSLEYDIKNKKIKVVAYQIA